MSALARWFLLNGKKVAGYDRTQTPLTEKLIAEGISVHYEDNVSLIPDHFVKEKEETLIIYTPAVPKDHKELGYFNQNGFQVKKRSEVLGALSKKYFTIAIAGTHGKTTTSSMVAHILKHSGRNMVAFLGGITTNYETNFIYTHPESKDTIAVVEADEFDRSFLQLNPDIAVITSADADHLDIYGNKSSLEESFRQFAGRIKKDGILFVNSRVAKKFPVKEGILMKTYSRNEGDLKSLGLRIKSGHYILDYQNGHDQINDLNLAVPGNHNVENLIVAVGVCLKLGLTKEEISAAVKTFTGVKRRFEYILKTDKVILIDDYAHHPVEIEAFLKTLKTLYQGRKITAIFQPHLYSRTRDFADGFAHSLSLADTVILLDIYPARELPIPGVTSEIIFDHVTSKEKILCSKSELTEKLRDIKDPGVVATIGAGDIDQLVEPVKQKLIELYGVE